MHASSATLQRYMKVPAVRRINAITDQVPTVGGYWDDVLYGDGTPAPQATVVLGGKLLDLEPRELTPEDVRSLSQFGWLYAWLDFNMVLLYLGKTKGRLRDRLSQHVTGPSAARRRSIAERRHPEHLVAWHLGDSASRCEAAALLALQPPLNTVGVAL